MAIAGTGGRQQVLSSEWGVFAIHTGSLRSGNICPESNPRRQQRKHSTAQRTQEAASFVKCPSVRMSECPNIRDLFPAAPPVHALSLVEPNPNPDNTESTAHSCMLSQSRPEGHSLLKPSRALWQACRFQLRGNYYSCARRQAGRQQAGLNRTFPQHSGFPLCITPYVSKNFPPTYYNNIVNNKPSLSPLVYPNSLDLNFVRCNPPPPPPPPPSPRCKAT